MRDFYRGPVIARAVSVGLRVGWWASDVVILKRRDDGLQMMGMAASTDGGSWRRRRIQLVQRGRLRRGHSCDNAFIHVGVCK